jgi:hypothetical protein
LTIPVHHWECRRRNKMSNKSDNIYDSQEKRETLIRSLCGLFISNHWKLFEVKGLEVPIKHLRLISNNRYEAEKHQKEAYLKLTKHFNFDEADCKTDKKIRFNRTLVEYFVDDFLREAVYDLSEIQVKNRYSDFSKRAKFFNPIKNLLLMFFTALKNTAALEYLKAENSEIVGGFFIKKSEKHVRGEVMDIVESYWNLVWDISRTFKYYLNTKPSSWLIKCIKSELDLKGYIIECKPNSSQEDESDEDIVEINERITIQKTRRWKPVQDEITLWKLLGEIFFEFILLDRQFGYVWKRINFVLKLFEFNPKDVIVGYHYRTVGEIVDKIKKWLKDILLLDENELNHLFHIVDEDINKTVAEIVPTQDHNTWETLKDYKESDIPIKDLRLTLFVKDEKPDIISGWNSRLLKKFIEYLKSLGFDIDNF